LIVVLAVAAFVLNTLGGDDSAAADKYCAKMKDGIMTVMHDGTALTSDVTLGDGSVLKTDGTVIKKNGMSTSLKDGECINQDGTVPLKETKREK